MRTIAIKCVKLMRIYPVEHLLCHHRLPENLLIFHWIRHCYKRLGLNILRIAESGLRDAVQKVKEMAWKRDNAAAMADYNDWIEEHGLPLARYRTF